MEGQRPSLGRVVHYTTAKGTTRPALIVAVWDDSPGVGAGACNLQVFTDRGNDLGDPDLLEGVSSGHVWRTSVVRSAGPKAGCWHWPQQAPGRADQRLETARLHGSRL